MKILTAENWLHNDLFAILYFLFGSLKNCFSGSGGNHNFSVSRPGVVPKGFFRDHYLSASSAWSFVKGRKRSFSNPKKTKEPNPWLSLVKEGL